MGDKLPWMPFYGTDFYNDEAVRLLTLEEEALYIRLLWWQWREGSLPGDWADCQRLAGESLGDRLAKLFPVTRSADGRRPVFQSTRSQRPSASRNTASTRPRTTTSPTLVSTGTSTKAGDLSAHGEALKVATISSRS